MNTSSNSTVFSEVSHEVDLCVVGGGMAGLCAALAAARHGIRVALMHDRPVLGGNASSEMRMHISGANRHELIPNLRETGILEELRLENLRRNHQRSYSVWDMILYEKVKDEPNITLLLNCSCLEATMNAPAIESVRGWQLTTQTYHRVKAAVFADCSGDAVLAPLSGAEYRVGREARSEYGESIAPEVADERTMGMTCLFQSRKYHTPQPFEPPHWAYRYESCEELPYGKQEHQWWEMGYWWVEMAGKHDSIADTETLRDELLKISLGVWDHVKNHCNNDAENWALDWIQFLPSKRESRRYIGEHVLTQLDIAAEGRFEDIVAYGGWTMDDHDPAGFGAVKLGHPATIFHPAPSPYGIPYRCLYSRNIVNLMFAGRCTSCTHAAMSSTRVMGTACVMGQAVGTAAALSIGYGVLPGQLGGHIKELQQTLLADDCYLPWVPRKLSLLTQKAQLHASRGDAEPVRDGFDRPIGNDLHRWDCESGDHMTYSFERLVKIKEITLTLDSGLDQNVQMSHLQADSQLTAPPEVMPRAFHLDALQGDNWVRLYTITDNHQRHRRFPVDQQLSGLRFTLDDPWGGKDSAVYAWDVS